MVACYRMIGGDRFSVIASDRDRIGFIKIHFKNVTHNVFIRYVKTYIRINKMYFQ